MSLEVQNTTQLLDLVLSNRLYEELIIQLNKDFSLSNIDVAISQKTTPTLLKQRLCKVIEELIQGEFDDFLNLLYRVDLSELSARKNSNQSAGEYIECVTFLILKREWQKVWFKHRYTS
ncbi:MAG: hypothetical protein ACPGU9_06900 [Flavobacteriaceae bacterium]